MSMHAERLERAWLALGISALVIAALHALALALLRVPALAAAFDGTHRLYGVALAMHVNFATHVWLLSCAMSLTAPGSGGFDRLAYVLALAGAAVMLASPWLGNPDAVMSNYVPVLEHRTFHAGLAIFAAGIVIAALRALARGAAVPPERRALALAVVAAFAVLVHAAWGMPASVTGAARYEVLFWGFGHVLQFAFVLLLIAVWRALAQGAGTPLPSVRAIPEWFTVAPLLALPWILLRYPLDDPAYRTAFSSLMAWGTWPGVLIAMGLALYAQRNKASLAGDGFARRTLVISMALFAGGLALGALVRDQTTLVPAHYHGTVGALTLALLGYLACATSASRARHVQGWVLAYGAGITTLVVSLAWMGMAGLPRKTPGYAGAEAGGAALLAAAGGTLAVLAAFACGAMLLRALWLDLRRDLRGLRSGVAENAAGAQRLRRDARPAAIGVTIGLIALGGLILSVDSRKPPSVPANASLSAVIDPPEQVRSKRTAEFGERFQQAVVMLHARQYEHAATALHRLLVLAPDVPEVHVNMGYAMFGLKRYAAARDFFLGAMDLRARQRNAYYGLAVSLEALGDMEGALGAMRTFVHLSAPDDPYVRKANAAIWEWESRSTGKG